MLSFLLVLLPSYCLATAIRWANGGVPSQHACIVPSDDDGDLVEKDAWTKSARDVRRARIDSCVSKIASGDASLVESCITHFLASTPSAGTETACRTMHDTATLGAVRSYCAHTVDATDAWWKDNDDLLPSR